MSTSVLPVTPVHSLYVVRELKKNRDVEARQHGFRSSDKWRCVVGWAISDVSKERSALFCKSLAFVLDWLPREDGCISLQTSPAIRPTTQRRHIQQAPNPQQHRCEIVKIRTSELYVSYFHKYQVTKINVRLMTAYDVTNSYFLLGESDYKTYMCLRGVR